MSLVLHFEVLRVFSHLFRGWTGTKAKVCYFFLMLCDSPQVLVCASDSFRGIWGLGRRESCFFFYRIN